MGSSSEQHKDNITSHVLYSKFFAVNQSFVLSFLQADLQCCVCFRSLLIVTPRFISSYMTCSDSLSVKHKWLLFLDRMCIVLHLLVLKDIRHFSDHRMIWSSSSSAALQSTITRDLRLSFVISKFRNKVFKEERGGRRRERGGGGKINEKKGSGRRNWCSE